MSKAFNYTMIDSYIITFIELFKILYTESHLIPDYIMDEDEIALTLSDSVATAEKLSEYEKHLTNNDFIAMYLALSFGCEILDNSIPVSASSYQICCKHAFSINKLMPCKISTIFFIFYLLSTSLLCYLWRLFLAFT